MTGKVRGWFPALRGGGAGRWRADTVAGLTLWVVLVPEVMAYATIAGVPPVVGLVASVASLAMYAALGTSSRVVMGPMAATAALSGATLASLHPTGPAEALALTAGLAILCGVAALVAGLLRMGFVVAMVSKPVLKGFVVGLSLAVVWGQLPVLLGAESAHGSFWKVGKIWLDVGDWFDVRSALIGIGGLTIMLVMRRYWPRSPAALVAVLGSLAVSWFLELPQAGVSSIGALEVGEIHMGWPSIELSRWGRLVGPALAVALVGFADGMGAARAVGTTVVPNRELIAQGGSNLGAGLVGGMVVNGSLSKSAVNRDAGARTQVSGLVAASLVVATLLWLGPVFAWLPHATLAAVVIAALWELVDFKGLVDLYHVGRSGKVEGVAVWADAAAAWVTFVGVIGLGVLEGLLVGVGGSLLLILYRASWPYIAELGVLEQEQGDLYVDQARHPEAQAVKGVVILRVESGFYFVNAEHVRRQVLKVARREGVRCVILDGESTPVIDVSAAQMLVKLAEELRKRDKVLAMARDVGQVRDILAEERKLRAMPHYASVGEAVEALAKDQT
ncbi:SulP family inorganic anion transporter [Lujinxingia litoralis]|uniref:SulP family inorganic anion transporter n=1 Tax=Lujinxingia litoralis TaxID=2211119 RepID=A0A328CA15_9DELT|nr:SulP family inorganic anion transporter [Lujinxingia litoralis]RAL23005.1 SulP family inorganic anion transporter [Lujinxingia litoralis]